MVAGPSIHEWDPKQRHLQHSFASVPAVSSSSRHVEAEALPGRLSVVDERIKNANHIIPDLQRVVENAVPILNMDSLLVQGALGTDFILFKGR